MYKKVEIFYGPQIVAGQGVAASPQGVELLEEINKSFPPNSGAQAFIVHNLKGEEIIFVTGPHETLFIDVNAQPPLVPKRISH